METTAAQLYSFRHTIAVGDLVIMLSHRSTKGAIGEVTGLNGFILAAGFSGHGFGIGPGAGHLIADLVTGATPIVDPRPYHPDRLNASVWGKVAEF